MIMTGTGTVETLCDLILEGSESYDNPGEIQMMNFFGTELIVTLYFKNGKVLNMDDKEIQKKYLENRSKNVLRWHVDELAGGCYRYKIIMEQGETHGE